jgi:multiple sugar transport system ATP-binding protein
LGIEELLERKPKELSGGQRQRVAVGRAIVRKPKVFLFDEPLSNLDAKLRVQMRTEISKLHTKLGATMIYVTHDQTEAMTMGDRIVIMNEGLINQIDSPLDIYTKPVNKFVAGFIGSPAMNFIDGKIIDNSGLKFISDRNDLEMRISGNSKIQNYIGADICLGIRPENVYSKITDEISGTKANVKLEVIEPMGNEILIYFQLAGKQCIGRVSPEFKGEAGDSVDVYLDNNKIHFFDRSTGEVIN